MDPDQPAAPDDPPPESPPSPPLPPEAEQKQEPGPTAAAPDRAHATPPTSPTPQRVGPPVFERGYTGRIDISQPLNRAFTAMQRLLFNPFDLVLWLKLGLCVFLTILVDTFGGLIMNLSQMGVNVVGSVLKPASGISAIEAIVIVVAIVFCVFVYAVFTWLESRGDFMVIEALARKPASLGKLWEAHGRSADALFVFRIVYRLSLFFVVGAIGGAGVLAAFPAINNKAAWSVASIVSLVLCSSLGALILLAGTLVDRFVTDFAVPTMWRTGQSPTAALRTIWPRVGPGHLGDLALFYLVRFGLALATALLAQMAACVTCCVGAIPYVNSVVMLPATLAVRGFSLRYYEQFGPDLAIFAEEPPTCPRCHYDLRGNPAATSCPECGAPLIPLQGAAATANPAAGT